jgi:hypothetical protein
MSSGDPSFILDNSDDGNAGSAGPNSATRRLLLAAVGNPASESWFERQDRPTLLVTAAIYASWLFLLASHRYIPWWIAAPLAGYVVQWHFSLQHEAIHSLRGIPGWLRRALVAQGALTQARKSRAASVTSSPIPKEIWSDSSCMKPAFRIAAALHASLLRSARTIPGCAIFADGGYAGDKLRKALKRIGEWTIEIINVPTRRRASKLCPADGSSNVLSHGSVAVADSQRISKRQSPAPLPGHSLRTSEPSPGDSQELEVKCNHYESDT